MPIAELRSWIAQYPDKPDLTGQMLHMWCPGCQELHAVELDPKNSPCWTWDGNIDAPTINPSIKVDGVQWHPAEGFYKPTHNVAPGEKITCHSFVRNGHWEFLGDCTHHLVSQTVPLPPLPEWFTEG